MLDVIEVTQRVAKGADFLDDLFGPEWVFRVDLNTLRMSSPCYCVAGQLHNGSFWSAITDWFDLPPLEEDERVSQHGFSLSLDDDEQDNWDLLQSAWVGFITIRRSRINAHGSVV